jgi:hypothetical protein
MGRVRQSLMRRYAAMPPLRTNRRRVRHDHHQRTRTRLSTGWFRRACGGLGRAFRPVARGKLRAQRCQLLAVDARAYRLQLLLVRREVVTQLNTNPLTSLLRVP